ncbi:MAG: FlgD immunoglobulin-like domain containing protein [Bacteroidia bacterium]
MKKLYIYFLITGISLTASAQLVYKDVAGIFYHRCTSCHHEHQHPQSMLNYTETYPWAASIQADLTSGKMPPWSPDTNYARFIHERIITAAEKNTILSWISSGAQKGDTTLAPPAPTYTQYQLYGTPDLVLRIPTFTSNASSSDAYNCFAVSTGLTADRIIRAYEVIPGNAAIVHHVVLKVDTTGTVASDLSGGCFTEPGSFDLGVWAPGSAPTIFPGQAPLKMGIRLKTGSKIVLQIHYPRGTAGQQDSTQIRIYFYPTTATGIRPVYVTTPLQNWSMSIAAGSVTPYTANYSIPAALSIYATFPHSHLICKSMLVYAYNTSPVDTIPLIRINKWDFNWQGFYTFPKMVKAPAGYKLFSKHVFDNTTNNPNNPSNPPALVVAGTSTTNEMLFDSFQYLLYQAGDENIRIDSLFLHDTLLNPVATSVNEIVLMNIHSYASPNPFSDFVKIGYELTYPAETSVSIYNMLGNEVTTISSQYNSAGTYTVNWNGRNETGTKVPAGIYFYTIRAGKSETSGKIVLMPK